MMKRIIAMFLAGVILLTSVQIPVRADEVITNLEEYEVIEEENADSIDEVIDDVIEITDEDDIIEVDDSTEEPLLGANAAQSKIHNPRSSNGVVTWDCVYFGNYWQNDTNGDGKADKDDAKEKIKWRVLSVDGNDALLIADQNLDCQRYNTPYTNVTWKTCTLRSWLNGYGSSSNVEGSNYSDSDKNFMDTAFSASEQSAIIQTTLVNADNPSNGTEGGDDTQDKIFLLSYDDAVNNSYGFSTDYSKLDEARWAKNTAYAKAAGAYTYSGGSYDGNGYWWLRSPGNHGGSAMDVNYDGDVDRYGSAVGISFHVVRPALHLNLSSSLYSYAGTVSAKGEIIEPEKIKSTINGRGYACKSFILKDNNEKVLKNTTINYYFEDESGNTLPGVYSETSDANGNISIKTKLYDNTSSLTAAPITDTVIAHLIYKPDGVNNIVSDTEIAFDVTVNPPSFIESWSLKDEATIKAGGYAGVKQEYGPAKVQFTVAEASATSNVGNAISVKNQYLNGKRFLELGQEYSANLGVNGSLGLSGKAKFGDLANVDVSLGKLSGGAKIGDKVYSGLQLEDYNPEDGSQLLRMGGFMFGSYAVSSGNVGAAILFKMINEKYDHMFTNVTSNVVNSSLSGSVDVASVSVGFKNNKIGTGEIMKLEGDTKYSYEQKYDDILNPSGKPIFVMEKEAYGKTRFVLGNLAINERVGASGQSLFDKDGYQNTYSMESRDNLFRINTYKSHGWDGNGLVYLRTDNRLDYEGEERTKLLNEVPAWKNFSNGKSILLLDSSFNEAVKSTETTDAKAKYTEHFKKTETITTGDLGSTELFNIPSGFGGFEGGASFKLTGIYSDEYALSSGTYEKGKVNITAVTDVGSADSLDIIKNPAGTNQLGELGAFKLIGEAFDAIVDDVKEFTLEVKEKITDVADGIKNGYCTVVCKVNNIKNRWVSIVTVKLVDSVVSRYDSYTIFAYDNKTEALLGGVGDKLNSTAHTLGNVYCISLYESDGTTQVNDFEDTPIEIIIEYDNEMLEAAGATSEDEDRIEIYRYDAENSCYISVGGEVDTDNNSVTADNITKSGQYILAIQGEDNNNNDIPSNDTDENNWINRLTKISNTEYVLNLATKEKYSLDELKKVKSDGKNYKIIYDKVGKKSDSQYAAMTATGLITAKKAGVSHITLNKGGVEYKITVNVFNPQFSYTNPKAKYFTVNTGETVTPVYDNQKLRPTFTLDKNAIKKGLATINPDTGEVTPLKKGNVKVTATVGGDQNSKYARKVTTTVKIYDPIINTGKKAEVMEGKVLKASVKNGVKTTTDWKSSNEAIATVDDRGRIKGMSVGTVTISCVNNGKAISKEITVIENPKLKK